MNEGYIKKISVKRTIWIDFVCLSIEQSISTKVWES